MHNQGRFSSKKPEPRRSYSEVTKTNEKPRQCTLVVKPVERQEGSSTRIDIKSKINISDMPVGVTEFKEMPNGTVIIGCNNENERDILQSGLESNLGNKYKVNQPKLKRPRFKIIGVEQEEEALDDEKLLSTIIKQNGLNMQEGHEDMKIIYKKMNKKYKNVSISIESDPVMFNEIIKRGRLNIGWKKYRVLEDIYIIRCYKCWGFNHFAKECKDCVRCGICAEQHDRKDCKSVSKKCVNCDKLARDRKSVV